MGELQKWHYDMNSRRDSSLWSHSHLSCLSVVTVNLSLLAFLSMARRKRKKSHMFFYSFSLPWIFLWVDWKVEHHIEFFNVLFLKMGVMTPAQTILALGIMGEKCLLACRKQISRVYGISPPHSLEMGVVGINCSPEVGLILQTLQTLLCCISSAETWCDIQLFAIQFMW